MPAPICVAQEHSIICCRIMATPNFDKHFDRIKSLRPERVVVFRKATAVDIATSTVTREPGRNIVAKVWDKPRTYDYNRGAYVIDDRTSLVIWFRDWFNRSNDVATPAEVAQMILDVRGKIREGDTERYSRWEIDGVSMKVESHSLIQRPDGQIYGARLWLVAAT